MVLLFGLNRQVELNSALVSTSTATAQIQLLRSSAEINWIALQSAPKGAQLGTTSLDSWTTGTECKKIDFPQVL